MLTQNTLDQERKMAESRKKLRWFVALSTLPLLGVVTAFGLVPQNELDLTSVEAAIQEIALPEEAEKKAIATEVHAETNAAGGLVSLRYLGDSATQVVIEKQGDGFTARTLPAELEKRLFVRTGEIQTNLYAATDAAGLPEATANKLNELFSGDIDFHHDLRKGDKFTVVYEMLYSNGALLSAGRIQAAEFVNQGRPYRAVYFEKDGQHGDYYTPEGKSVRKTFLRSPLEYSRVSSGFTNSRFHPVLNKWRARKGVDFAAPTGTRVKATADGMVTSVGRENGYGNVIKISHQGRYSTVYGHLSRYAKDLHRGQRVAQGEVVGYVGMTGLASGPHLHYEFKVDGQQHNPMRVALPDAKPVDDADRGALQSVADDLVTRLNLLRNTNLARLD